MLVQQPGFNTACQQQGHTLVNTQTFRKISILQFICFVYFQMFMTMNKFKMYVGPVGSKESCLADQHGPVSCNHI